jgi:hypothetical protein
LRGRAAAAIFNAVFLPSAAKKHKLPKSVTSARLAPFLESYVQIQKASYHLLVLRVVLLGFLLEEVNGGLAQSDSDFNLFLIKCQLSRRRKKIINYSYVA